jgi:hypothetical protein
MEKLFMENANWNRRHTLLLAYRRSIVIIQLHVSLFFASVLWRLRNA